MLKESIKGISFLTLITLFFFVCCSLYLIGFWSTFDVDISNLVDVAEIPKSFILPFILSNVYGLVIMVFTFLTSHSKKDELVGVDNRQWPSKKAVIFLDFILTILIGFIPPIMFWFYDKYKYNQGYWLIWGTITAFLVALKINSLPFIKKEIPNSSIRYFLINLTVFTICMSFALGKAKSVKIYTNSDVKYIAAKTNNKSIEIQPSNDTSRLKLLGFLGNKIIVSSLDNKKIYILPQSNVGVLTIENK